MCHCKNSKLWEAPRCHSSNRCLTVEERLEKKCAPDSLHLNNIQNWKVLLTSLFSLRSPYWHLNRKLKTFMMLFTSQKRLRGKCSHHELNMSLRRSLESLMFVVKDLSIYLLSWIFSQEKFWRYSQKNVCKREAEEKYRDRCPLPHYFLPSLLSLNTTYSVAFIIRQRLKRSYCCLLLCFLQIKLQKADLQSTDFILIVTAIQTLHS